MKTYILEYYITRNTTQSREYKSANFAGAKREAKRLSFTNEMPVRAINPYTGAYAKYHHNELVEELK